MHVWNCLWERTKSKTSNHIWRSIDKGDPWKNSKIREKEFIRSKPQWKISSLNLHLRSNPSPRGQISSTSLHLRKSKSKRANLMYQPIFEEIKDQKKKFHVFYT